MRARFEGLAHEESRSQSPTGTEIAFRIGLSQLLDAVPLGDPARHAPPVGPLLPDQRVEVITDDGTWHDWAWNVEVEQYDFDYATRRITGTLRFDMAVPAPPPPSPPVPVTAPAALAPPAAAVDTTRIDTPAPDAPRPLATPATSRPATPLASSSARLPLPDSTRWLRVLLLALLGLALTALVVTRRGPVFGAVMGAVTLLVLWSVTRTRSSSFSRLG